jgi:hypothetical protein
MRKVIYIFYKPDRFHNEPLLYKAVCSSTTIGAYIKALWLTRFKWKIYKYVLE